MLEQKLLGVQHGPRDVFQAGPAIAGRVEVAEERFVLVGARCATEGEPIQLMDVRLVGDVGLGRRLFGSAGGRSVEAVARGEMLVQRGEVVLGKDSVIDENLGDQALPAEGRVVLALTDGEASRTGVGSDATRLRDRLSLAVEPARQLLPSTLECERCDERFTSMISAKSS